MSVTLENKAVTQTFFDAEWKQSKEYRIHLLITKDEADSYSAVAMNLPGAGSCGATVDEAVENARQAVLAALDVYGDEVPWTEFSTSDIPAGAIRKTIILHA